MNEGGKTFLQRTKTKELMEDKVECRDGISPFGILILRFMQGCCIFTALENSSFASFLLISSSFLFNSSSCPTLSFSSYSFLSFSPFSFLNISYTFRSSLSLISFSTFFLSSCSLCFWNALSLFSDKSMSRRFLYLATRRKNCGSLSMKSRPLSTSFLNSRLSAWVLLKLVGTNCRLMQALKSFQFRMAYFLPMWTRFCLECHHSYACVINLEVHKSIIQYVLLLILNASNF